MSTGLPKDPFDRDGYVVVPGLLSSEISPSSSPTSTAISARSCRTCRKAMRLRGQVSPETLKQLQRMERDPFFRDYANHPTWSGMARSLLGEDVVSMRSSGSTSRPARPARRLPTRTTITSTSSRPAWSPSGWPSIRSTRRTAASATSRAHIAGASAPTPDRDSSASPRGSRLRAGRRLPRGADPPATERRGGPSRRDHPSRRPEPLGVPPPARLRHGVSGRELPTR